MLECVVNYWYICFQSWPMLYKNHIQIPSDWVSWTQYRRGYWKLKYLWGYYEGTLQLSYALFSNSCHKSVIVLLIGYIGIQYCCGYSKLEYLWGYFAGTLQLLHAQYCGALHTGTDNGFTGSGSRSGFNVVARELHTARSSDPDRGCVEAKWSLNLDPRSASDTDPRSRVESPCYCCHKSVIVPS